MINTNNALSTFTIVDSSTDPTVLVEEKGNRVGLYIYNNSSARLKILIGSLPEDAEMTSDDFSFILAAGGLYEMPSGYTTLKFTGIWESENGVANVTEIRDN